MEEPLSQANERAVNDQDIITEETPAADMGFNQDSIRSDDTTAAKVQEIITEQMANKEANETPAEDVELSQDGSTKSENRTSFGTHINVPISDKKGHPEGQAEEEAPSYSETEELRKQVTEGQPFLT